MHARRAIEKRSTFEIRDFQIFFFINFQNSQMVICLAWALLVRAVLISGCSLNLNRYRGLSSAVNDYDVGPFPIYGRNSNRFPRELIHKSLLYYPDYDFNRNEWIQPGRRNGWMPIP